MSDTRTTEAWERIYEDIEAHIETYFRDQGTDETDGELLDFIYHDAKVWSAIREAIANSKLGEMRKLTTVAENRNYKVKSVKEVKKIALSWLNGISGIESMGFGLPEIDDRYHIWRTPIIRKKNKTRIGEIVIDARTSLVDEKKSTKKEVVLNRLLKKHDLEAIEKNGKSVYTLSPLRNTIALGDSASVLSNMPAESIDLIFTSPPYYNARPEYTDYVTYEEYLLQIRKVIQQCHRVLSDGRFFVINIAPVLIRRNTRSEASKRIAVPFDFHRIFIEEGFDFIDDIIWVKPEGAGWATGRGRRFAADRNPLQYKAVPVTEYVLVYRKKTDKLIDWFIRNHPDRSVIRDSKIDDSYEKTNIWKIHPRFSKKHPAIFPVELAEKVIRYYSFKNDVVLDPFAGIGTVGAAATKLHRRFVLIELNKNYIEVIRSEAKTWLGKKADSLLCVNCETVSSDDFLI